ncbi:MAG: sigma-70 family RNA polymerase sigma factor [Acidobacteriota bacterium]
MVAESLPAELSDPDREILSRVAAGDAEAFGSLVERHQERLLRLCERMLGDVEEARDVTQEVFLKAYGKAGRFQPRGQVFTWLYRIAVNHCLNRLRRKKVVQFLRLAPAADEAAGRGETALDPASPLADAGEQLETRERWRQVRRAIDALPSGQRSVVILARFEGLAYRDIAEVLGITRGAVESRLFRAMRTLEKVLDGESLEPEGTRS